MKIYQVQAQASCVTSSDWNAGNGWHFSRQIRTMLIAANSPADAAIELSYLVWDLLPEATDRLIVATVLDLDTDGVCTVRVSDRIGWINAEAVRGDV